MEGGQTTEAGAIVKFESHPHPNHTTGWAMTIPSRRSQVPRLRDDLRVCKFRDRPIPPLSACHRIGFSTKSDAEINSHTQPNMEILSIILMAIGSIIALIYGIQLLILAFQKSVLWGLGYLCVPFVALIFVFMHWEETKRPFLRVLLAIPFFVVAGLIAPQRFAAIE
jgi:hypothetical protein